ncbi:sulfotransferase family 2 domain-containing protein [Halomonas sp. CH40]
MDIIPFNLWALNNLKLFEKNNFHLDNHLRPQVEFLDQDFDVFKFEDGFNHLVEVLSKEMKIPSDELCLEHVNKSMSLDIEIDIDANVIDKIYDIYKFDFNVFGYSL